MLTYKNLYCSLVRSMSEAIDLYDEGKGILAREGLKKALLDAGKSSEASAVCTACADEGC